MNKEPQPKSSTIAYALVALAIWAMAAYDLIVPKPHPVLNFAAIRLACVD